MTSPAKTISAKRTDFARDIDSYISIARDGGVVSVSDGGVVMVSGANWNAMMETLHLCSIPGMEKSIIDGMKEPLENCALDAGL